MMMKEAALMFSSPPNRYRVLAAHLHVSPSYSVSSSSTTTIKAPLTNNDSSPNKLSPAVFSAPCPSPAQPIQTLSDPALPNKKLLPWPYLLPYSRAGAKTKARTKGKTRAPLPRFVVPHAMASVLGHVKTGVGMPRLAKRSDLVRDCLASRNDDDTDGRVGLLLTARSRPYRTGSSTSRRIQRGLDQSRPQELSIKQLVVLPRIRISLPYLPSHGHGHRMLSLATNQCIRAVEKLASTLFQKRGARPLAFNFPPAWVGSVAE
ncbi:hypothetical protein BKA80DRAFT_275079 [Phyllosticta citrichinensis]